MMEPTELEPTVTPPPVIAEGAEPVEPTEGVQNPEESVIAGNNPVEPEPADEAEELTVLGYTQDIVANIGHAASLGEAFLRTHGGDLLPNQRESAEELVAAIDAILPKLDYSEDDGA